MNAATTDDGLRSISLDEGVPAIAQLRLTDGYSEKWMENRREHAVDHESGEADARVPLKNLGVQLLLFQGVAKSRWMRNING